jgi:hypothetical protein
MLNLNRKVNWDYDTGICGGWKLNVAGTSPDRLVADLFCRREHNPILDNASYASTAELRKALEDYRAMMTYCTDPQGNVTDENKLTDYQDLIALLESALVRYTGSNHQQPIMFAVM